MCNIEKNYDLMIGCIDIDIDYNDDELLYYVGMYNAIINKFDEAIKFYRLSVELGNDDGVNNLGCMYDIETNINIKKNMNETIGLYKMVVEKVIIMQMGNLWCLYKNGSGVRRNIDEAIRLWWLCEWTYWVYWLGLLFAQILVELGFYRWTNNYIIIDFEEWIYIWV